MQINEQEGERGRKGRYRVVVESAVQKSDRVRAKKASGEKRGRESRMRRGSEREREKAREQNTQGENERVRARRGQGKREEERERDKRAN